MIVDALGPHIIVDVAVGALHCLAVTEKGEVFAWGDNDHGQQGNGNIQVNKVPTKVQGLEGHKITKVACGSSHSIAWTTTDVSAPINHEPVFFQALNDPLGQSYVLGANDEEESSEDAERQMNVAKISLARAVLAQKTLQARQSALTHILNALRIHFCRQAIVSAFSIAPLTNETVQDRHIASNFPSMHNLAQAASPADCIAAETFKPMEQTKTNSTLDDFVFKLKIDDARMLVNLLKLCITRRLCSKQELTHVLKALAKHSCEMSDLILELCVVELEEAAADNETAKISEKPEVVESSHPYSDECNLTEVVRIPGAHSLRVEFDKRCSTEKRHDPLIIRDSSGKVVCERSGRDLADWSMHVIVPGEELRWEFKSDSSVNGWGWKFTVYPIHTSSTPDYILSDRSLLSKPSIQLVICLLDFKTLLQSQSGILPRMASALATTAQLPCLIPSQRMWALDQLRSLHSYLKEGSISTDKGALQSLVKALPETLQRQFDYEETFLRKNQQLMHSKFFRTLVALASDLNLDYLPICVESQQWAWLRRACEAQRVVEALLYRNPLPSSFCEGVWKKVQELSDSTEGANYNQSRLYEDHVMFTKNKDEQLLTWNIRRPDEWTLSWAGSGVIWGWGHNHRGQLGGLEGAKVKVPTPCESFANLRPVQIVGGEQTLFVVSSDGKVHATGYGASGRLGIGSSDCVSIPTTLESIQHVFIKKVSVNAGGKHCLALSADGDVYSWGEGEDGKLGHGNRQTCDKPRIIESLRGKEVTDIAAGGAHSAAISAQGELYTWGKGRYGRLGHGDSEDQTKPKIVEALRLTKVLDVACGSGDSQTLCITEGDIVWSWGDGDYGKLGRGGSEGCKVPEKVDKLRGLEVCKVECGSQFSVALTRTGAIYTWGKGDYQRLGHGTDDHVRTPKRVVGLEGKKIVTFACGSLHCIACTDTGDVYTWGDNDEGQLGDATTNAIPRPRLVATLDGKRINRVACGSAHSIAWSTSKPTRTCRLPTSIPLEYSELTGMDMSLLRNRLVLLHTASQLICPSFPMLSIPGLESNNLRSLLTLQAKESIFKKTLHSTMVRDKQHGPVIDINRMQVKRNKSEKDPDGLRSVFYQVCEKMDLLSNDHLMLAHRVWKVKFAGESVDDCGGGYSESIAEMCDELQSGVVPLLIVTPNGRDELGANRDCFILNPTLKSVRHKKMFNFFGVILGIAIRTGSPLSLSLAEPVWKQLAGMKLDVKDLNEIDKDYLPGLMYIQNMNDDELIAADMPFTTPSAAGGCHVIQLSTRYSNISPSNKQEYAKLALDNRLNEFNTTVQWVREGMAKIIPIPLLSLFTGTELETMVCGSPDIPIGMLKSVAAYKGVDANTLLVKWFWEVMEELDNSERSLFLRFVWGRTRLPRTIADFRGRDFVLQILDKYNPPDDFLPESYTCFFLLKLPRYSSKEILRHKLRYAIHFCKSIDTDDYARVALTSDPMEDVREGTETPPPISRSVSAIATETASDEAEWDGMTDAINASLMEDQACPRNSDPNDQSEETE